jgi:hypothetical protein
VPDSSPERKGGSGSRPTFLAGPSPTTVSCNASAVKHRYGQPSAF